MVSMSFDWTLLVQIANFLILIFVLNMILFKPLKKLMASRRELVESLKTGADAARERLAEGEAEQERFLVEVLQEGVGLHKSLKEEGRARELQILSEAQRKAAGRLDEARATMSGEVAEARASLRAEAESLAAGLVDKLLGRTPGTTLH
ncbi:MAG: ATP synthase F0 subunit B [Deltaproteobacteria bacterium]|jgi:F-type H+-transporting ATPase subunit b|nr:ATP synthase F0 subunit B [Deltaproteobacteria bacterium]